MSSPDVVVIGGGAIGLGIAWRAAERGLKLVVVDEPRDGAASSVAAGMLAPVTEVHYGEERLLALNVASSKIYARWVGELEAASGSNVQLEPCGTLMIARDTDDNAALDDVFRYQQELDLRVERLNGRDCRAAEPALARSVRGGILAEGDHQVDPSALTSALRRAASAAGAEMVDGRAEGILVSEDAATGVRLADATTLAAGAVVVAAGAWAGAPLLADSSLLPEGWPVRPVKGQLVHLRARRAPRLTHNVRGLDVYLVPRRDGRLVVGATVEERGFDTTASAGAVHALLRYAYELFPGIDEYDFEGVTVGLRPGTPDNAPLLGPTSLRNLVAATGHYRNGILLTPITAELITELLVSGETPDELLPFAPARFVARAEEAAP